MVDADLGRVPFLCCRNLSLIVPVYGLDLSRLKTEFIRGVRDLRSNTASNEAFVDALDNSSFWPRMEVQLP